jgi:hypothetical protein
MTIYWSYLHIRIIEWFLVYNGQSKRREVSLSKLCLELADEIDILKRIETK